MAVRLGLRLKNGCMIAHGNGTNVKRPFVDIPNLVMHELSPGSRLAKTPVSVDGPTPAASFHGQFGLIPFTTEHRLPQHVHIGDDPTAPERRMLVTERILVLNGVALVQLSGAVYIIPPASLVSIAPGVPHTWTACPPGLKMPDGTISDGTFLMVYEYESPTGFFPTEQTETLSDVGKYKEYTGDLENIRFPLLTTQDVSKRGTLVWDTELREAELAPR